MARNNVTFRDLVAIARRTGVAVKEAPSSHRGDLGSMGTVRGVTCHYTGTRNSFQPLEDYPDFNVVKEGRAGLWNSLSAWGLGRWKYIYVFSEFLSWHAGVWNWKGITDGNGDFLGIEAAGVGDWTTWQRSIYPRLVASALDFLGEDESMAPTHAMGAMPRGRKVDFLNTDSGWLPDLPQAPHSFHGAVAWLLKNPAYINVNYQPQEEFLMGLSDAEQKRLLENTDQLVTIFRDADNSKDPKDRHGRVWALLTTLRDELTKPRASLIEDAEGQPLVTTDLMGFQLYDDRHVWELNREKVPELIEKVDELLQLVSTLTTPAPPAST